MGLDTGINIINLSELKLFIEGNTSASTALDGRYEEIINDVSQYMNTYCGRHLKSSTYTSDYDGTGTTELMICNFPISSTAITITIDPTRTFTTDYQIPSTDIIAYYDEGILVLDNYLFSAGKQNVRIAYTGGYSSSAMPYDLKRAAKELAQFFYSREIKRDRIGIRNESIEGGSRTYETDLPWSVKKILDNYRSRLY